MQFADIILPLNLPQTLTYGVPLQWQETLQPGMRVEVNMGKNKLYSGVVLRLHNHRPENFQIKPVKNVIDDASVVNLLQLKFWEWVAQYYMCSIGEVMQAALPTHLKLMSETLLVWNDLYSDVPHGLSDNAFILAEALLIRKQITINECRKMLENSNPATAINELLSLQVAIVKEVLEERYTSRKEKFVFLENYYEDEKNLEALFKKLEPHHKQLEALMAFLNLRQQRSFVPYHDLITGEKISTSSINTLLKNNVIKIEIKEVDRIIEENKEQKDFLLSHDQAIALQEIKEQWKQHNVTLLQGVTGSGKTLLYIELIKEAIRQDHQTLLLLPEIALTTQVVARLRHFFGEELGVYHSRFTNNERVEIWNKVKDKKYKVVLGPRSALWLPFQKLDCIIVDEEHDASYKQQEPAPRFHARDAAIYLASLHQAKVLLGSATPSVESIYNVQQKKYGFAALKNRYQNVALPTIEVVSSKNYQAALSGIITTPLLDGITKTLAEGRQVILFQNKRGYAPFLICASCGWVAHCKNCDVSLTYHKATDKLHCHYCGTRFAPVKHCPQCGNARIISKSFGTEKVEEELLRIFPKIRTARMDLDSVKGKFKHAQLIEDFTRGRVDILVGTQMVVKGLDFDNVGLVGIISADSLLSYPDFRVNERAFQLMQQVSGRAGRSDGNGHVIIQAYNLTHPILKWVQQNDFRSFYQTEIATRQQFQYPPFVKFVKLTCRHRDGKKAEQASHDLAKLLLNKENMYMQGPAPSLVPRVRNYYLYELWIRIPRDAGLLQSAKEEISIAANEILRKRGNAGLQIIIDVDTV